jgi:type IV secretion system protein VirB10
MEESPNSLQPPKPKGRKLSKKPLYWFFAAVAVMLGMLWYAIERTDNRAAKQAEKKVTKVDERPLAQGQGPGLALPPAQTPAVAIQEAKESKKNEPLVVVQRDEAKDKEAEALRKRKEQAYFAALSSPLVAKRGTTGTKKGEPQPDQPGSMVKNTINSSSNTSAPGQDGYDPAADVDKEGFFTRADTRDGEGGWLSRYTREAGRKYEVKTGTVIPAVMVTGINSDLPGVMIAQISQTVFDTATGKYLLFPQGAKLYGVYDARVAYGQRRVLVAWNRVVFPDGSSVPLGAMPGADMSGFSGFEDQVDNHYFRIFGSAFLMSAITGGVSYAVDNSSNNDTYSNRTTFQDAMASALAAQVGAAAMRLLEKNLNIKPTLEIRPGYQFNVVVTKDIAFKGPYREEHYGTVRP